MSVSQVNKISVVVDSLFIVAPMAFDGSVVLVLLCST